MRVCIIGAGDAGAIASLQVRRLDANAELDVFSKNEELGCPPCEMPLVLGGSVEKWEGLYRGMRKKSFYEKRGINLHLNTEVTDINRGEKCIVAGGKYKYDKLILALGGTPTIPSIPGLNGKSEYTLSTNIKDAKALENAIFKYNSAAIIGGGFLALEVAAALKARGYDKVYMLVRQTIMRAYLDVDMTETIEKAIVENGVELIMPADIVEVETVNGKKRVVLSDREIEADFIFFGTGSKPDVELAQKAGLEIGETGAIAVNRYLQTSDPDIYAAGDCMENWDMITGSKRRIQLATSAIRTGYIAARNAILGDELSYKGTVMPFVTKIFGYQVGTVGHMERVAREEMDVVSVLVNTPRLREVFDGKPAWYKLVAERENQTLVGAQVISQEIVSGTIDKLAVAIANKMEVIKLLQIDSCYSPHVQEDQIAVPLQRLVDALRT